MVLSVRCTVAESKPFVECDRDELVRAVPELAGVQFEPSEDRIDVLLQVPGDGLRGMFAELGGISAAEEIHEMRFEDSMGEAGRHESFRYVVRPLAGGVREPFEELRTDPNTGLAVQVEVKSDFLITGHFFKLLHYLLPEYRGQSRFRYLGRWTAPGGDYFVVAFAASTLAPDNAAFKERYERLERASNVPAAAATDTTIKVEVRQVLVPVIVTDKEGHHMTGLTQADFRIFEDGVEQKISAFSVEDAGVSTPARVPATAAAAEAPRAGTAQKRAAIRRTYLICIDSFHSAFANLVHVREALSKLFQEEQG